MARPLSDQTAPSAHATARPTEPCRQGGQRSLSLQRRGRRRARRLASEALLAGAALCGLCCLASEGLGWDGAVAGHIFLASNSKAVANAGQREQSTAVTNGAPRRQTSGIVCTTDGLGNACKLISRPEDCAKCENECFYDDWQAECKPRTLVFGQGDKLTLKENRQGGILLHVMGLLYTFVAIAIVCDEFFVPTLEVIIDILSLSPDVAGATFMAAGGSAPEFFTSIIGVLVYKTSNIGVGTIVGSAVFNVLFCIGACAFVAPTKLQLSAFPLARDSSFYVVMLCLLTIFFYTDRAVQVWEAVVMFLLYFVYLAFMKNSERIEQRFFGGEPVSDESCWAKPRDQGEGNKTAPAPDSPAKGLCSVVPVAEPPPTASPQPPPVPRDAATGETSCQDPFASSGITLEPTCTDGGTGSHDGVTAVSEATITAEDPSPGTEAGKEDASGSEEDGEPLDCWPPGSDALFKDWFWYILTLPIVGILVCTIPDVRREGWSKFYPLSFFLSTLWIAIITSFMLWFATIIAEAAGWSEAVVAIILLSAGTSVPDLLTSIIVTRQGHGDMAISSSIGSNIFDVTICLPVPWMLNALLSKPMGLDLPVLDSGWILVLVLMLMVVLTVFTIMLSGWAMTRFMGFAMIMLFVAFDVGAVLITMQGTLNVR